MAIKYYHVPERGETIAVMKNCQYDVCNKLNKMIAGTGLYAEIYGERYLLPETFKVVTRVHGSDVYDEQTGERIAKAKMIKKYRKVFNRKMDLFNADIANITNKMTEFFNKTNAAANS